MHFIVELYLRSRLGRHRADRRARPPGAEELAGEGAGINHLRSTHVPGDEMCLLVYEAPNRELVLEAARRSGLAFERRVEAIEAVP